MLRCFALASLALFRSGYRGTHEFTYVSLSQVIVKSIATGHRIVLKSNVGFEIQKINIFQVQWCEPDDEAPLNQTPRDTRLPPRLHCFAPFFFCRFLRGRTSDQWLLRATNGMLRPPSLLAGPVLGGQYAREHLARRFADLPRGPAEPIPQELIRTRSFRSVGLTVDLEATPLNARRRDGASPAHAVSKASEQAS